ncbi:MAG: MFS transporter [Bacteroidales bacterium]|nr:MFS transporter [Bacteroidales bacterium]
MKYITKTVIILSLISLFTDIASEMLFPVIPLYLASLNYTPVYIGILEGVAELVAGLSKGYFGVLSDKLQKRAIFVKLGYSLSALAKPLMILFQNWFWILLMRASDRLGKGIRTGARDAILSQQATPQTKGRVFGFHRAMDTLGAAIGPLIALVFLYFNPENYRTLFLLALIPGIITILMVLFIKDVNKTNKLQNNKTFDLLSFVRFYFRSSKQYKYLTAGLLFFTLFNSSDMFLLLKVKEAGYDDYTVIGFYVFYNLIYALMSYPSGILADKYGLLNVLLFGFTIFAIVYLGLAFASSILIIAMLFALYGIYSAATEGISKALISNIEKENVASAIGTYTAFQSILTLLASFMTGLLWTFFGSHVAFVVISSASFLVVIYFFILARKSLLSLT